MGQEKHIRDPKKETMRGRLTKKGKNMEKKRKGIGKKETLENENKRNKKMRRKII